MTPQQRHAKLEAFLKPLRFRYKGSREAWRDMEDLLKDLEYEAILYR